VNGEHDDLCLVNESHGIRKSAENGDHSHDTATARPSQTYSAGLVKSRELAHDAQLFRLFRAEVRRIEAPGGRIRHVVLDYELKRDYRRAALRLDEGESAPPWDREYRTGSQLRNPFSKLPAPQFTLAGR
jgi:hypothetical protein